MYEKTQEKLDALRAMEEVIPLEDDEEDDIEYENDEDDNASQNSRQTKQSESTKFKNDKN